MRGKLGLLAVAAAMLLGGIGQAHADEPIFGYIYTTDLLPEGKFELEQWATLREGRSEGSFSLLQTRTEASYGLTDRLQVSGYANLAWADVNHNTPSGDTLPPEVFADYASDPDSRFKQFRVESFSAEALYRFLSPYTDPLGAALYIEPSVGPRTRELETRLILQKNFLDDRLIFAFNTTLGYEWRYLMGDPEADAGSEEARDHWDKETDVNFGLAGSYRFVSNWSAGLELQNEREWADLNPFKSENRTNSAYYFGPTLHYANDHFFVTATVLKQLPWAQDFANTGADRVVVGGISNADDFENYRYRLKLGYYF